MINSLPQSLIDTARKVLMESIEEPKIARTEKGSVIKRSKLGVGKDIGGEIYLHKQYENHVPDQEKLNVAKNTLAKNHQDFQYNALKFNKTGDFTFFNSPDFDTAHEPVAGNYVKVSGDTSKAGKTSSIWHHKWLWVKDDYNGFDVNHSYERSKKWLKLPNIDFNRIGNKDVWEKDYVPHINESTNESLRFTVDNPGGSWLEGKQETARSFMHKYGNSDTHLGKGFSGAVTGYYNKPVNLPVRYISNLPGAIGEEEYRMSPNNPKMHSLEKEIGDPSKFDSKTHPIFIAVNHLGHSYVMEGNHRLEYARKHGISHIHAEVRYFNGGEAVDKQMHPSKIKELHKETD